MNLNHFRHLKKLLLSFLAVTLIIVLGFASIMQITYEHRNRDAQQQLMEVHVHSFVQRFAQTEQELLAVAKRLSYASSVQKCLLYKSVLEYQSSLPFARELIQHAVDTSNRLIRHLFFTSVDHDFYLSGYYTDVRLSAAQTYALKRPAELTTPFFSEICYSKTSPGKPLVLFVFPFRSVIPGSLGDGGFFASCNLICDVEHLIQNSLPSGEVSLVVLDSSQQMLIRHSTRVETLQPMMTSRSGYQFHPAEQLITYRGVLEPLQLEFILSMPVASGMGEKKPESRIVIAEIAIALLFLLCAVLIRTIISSIVKPLATIMHEMDGIVQSDDLKRRISTPKNSDFNQLVSSMNNMLYRLDLSVQERHEQERQMYHIRSEQRKAELLAYKRQIDPHFLYNSLECIRSMSQAGARDQVDHMCTAMSNLFRYSVSSRAFVPLREEVRHSVDYFDIMNMRFGSTCELRLRVEPETLDLPVYPLILQPLVENSMKHAFPGNTKANILALRIEAKDDWLVIKVTDNGNGASQEQLESIFHSHSDTVQSRAYGLRNIIKRMEYLFGKNQHFHVRSSEGHYFQIEIRMSIPVLMDIETLIPGTSSENAASVRG